MRKLPTKMTEIKEMRTNITAGKSGVEITVRTTLYSDINIPEVTEKIQNLIRLRLQEILGIEEKVTIKIHVTKIVEREKVKEKKEIASGGFKGEFEYGKKEETRP